MTALNIRIQKGLFMLRFRFVLAAAVPLVFLGACLLPAVQSKTSSQVITGEAAFGDFSQQKPGTFRKITVADLPQPFATESAFNQPSVIARPADAWPQALPGFKVDLYASGLDEPRLMRTAPNGYLFLAESKTGKVKVFRGVGKDGKAETTEVFATGLELLFFFFHAEDGIRDFHVTGVQTCALPIWRRRRAAGATTRRRPPGPCAR